MKVVGRGDRQKNVKRQTIRASALHLLHLPDIYAVCRLAKDAPIPTWATGDFISITRTSDELSIVCPQDLVPADTKSELGWRCLRVAGTLDFSEIGVLAALAGPLAEAGISIFVVSTFDTDYLMIKDDDLSNAATLLHEAGHEVGQAEYRPSESANKRDA